MQELSHALKTSWNPGSEMKQAGCKPGRLFNEIPWRGRMSGSELITRPLCHQGPLRCLVCNWISVTSRYQHCMIKCFLHFHWSQYIFISSYRIFTFQQANMTCVSEKWKNKVIVNKDYLRQLFKFYITVKTCKLIKYCFTLLLFCWLVIWIKNHAWALLLLCSQ